MKRSKRIMRGTSLQNDGRAHDVEDRLPATGWRAEWCRNFVYNGPRMLRFLIERYGGHAVAQVDTAFRKIAVRGRLSRPTVATRPEP